MKIYSEGNVLKELLQLLKLEQIEENIFRGQSQDLGFGNVYGGQVLGQALSAAYQTVPPERRAEFHSRPSVFSMQKLTASQPFSLVLDAEPGMESFH